MNLFILVFISLGTAIGSLFYIKSALVSLFKGGINNMLSGELPLIEGGSGGKEKVKFLEKEMPTKAPDAIDSVGNESGMDEITSSTTTTTSKPRTVSNNADNSSPIDTANSDNFVNLNNEKRVDIDENGDLIVGEPGSEKLKIIGIHKFLQKKNYVKISESSENSAPNMNLSEKKKNIDDVLEQITLADGSKLGEGARINLKKGKSFDALIKHEGFSELLRAIMISNPQLNLEEIDDTTKVMKIIQRTFKSVDDIKIVEQDKKGKELENGNQNINDRLIANVDLIMRYVEAMQKNEKNGGKQEPQGNRQEIRMAVEKVRESISKDREEVKKALGLDDSAILAINYSYNTYENSKSKKKKGGKDKDKRFDNLLKQIYDILRERQHVEDDNQNVQKEDMPIGPTRLLADRSVDRSDNLEEQSSSNSDGTKI